MVVVGRIFSRPSKATRLRAKEDIVSAAHAYAVALSLEGDNSDTHLQIGHLHKVRGDTQKAAQSYKSALKLNSGNSHVAKELRALGASDQELASIIDGGKEDRRNIGLSPVDQGLAARFSPSAREHSQPAAGREDRSTLEPAERLPTVVDMSSAPKEVSPQVGKLATISTIPQQRKLVAQGGPPIRRRKWGLSLAAVIIVLSLVSGGALMLMAPPIEIAQDAYRRAVTEMQRRTARENAEAEAAARKAAQEKAAEEKLAAEAAARRHEEEARQAAAEMARAEAARKTAEAEARAAARGDARLKAEEAARKAEEGKPKSDAEIRQQAERAEAGLNLSEQDRKRVQVALNSLGHEIPTATGYFGPRTRAMITAWQKTQGLPETSYLTEIQLATLRQQAAPALAKYDQAHRRPKED
jgi:Putative peptidoglycan binding domain